MSSFVVISSQTARKHPFSPVFFRANARARQKKALMAFLFTMSKSVGSNKNKYRTFIGKVKGVYGPVKGNRNGGTLGGDRLFLPWQKLPVPELSPDFRNVGSNGQSSNNALQADPWYYANSLEVRIFNKINEMSSSVSIIFPRFPKFDNINLGFQYINFNT